MDSQQPVSNATPQQPAAEASESTNNVTEAEFQVQQNPQLPPLAPNAPAPKKTPNLLLIAVIVIVVLLLAGSGIFAYFQLKNSPPELTQPEPSPTPIATESPSFKLPTAPTIATDSGTITYSNIQQGYGFNYLKAWIIDKQGTLTVAADPSLPDSKQCTATIEKLLACGAMISSIPFVTPPTTAPGVTISGTSPTKTHAQQIQDLASQLAVSNKTSSITIGTLNGYEAITTTTAGSTYNVLLQGQKNMILIQFPNKKTRTELSIGQSTILESITEK